MPPSPEPAAPTGVVPTSRHTPQLAAVLAAGLAILMSVLDGAMTNIALPVLTAEFKVGAAEAVWIVKANQLAVAVSLLPLAALGESIGYRRVFRGGLCVFLVASLLCTLATSLTGLAAARALQGLGVAGIMSVNAALLRAIYPPSRLGRGISINAMIVGTSSAAGPTVASAILSVAHWHWLYAVNIPVALLVLALSRSLPSAAGSGRPLDWLSTALNVATLGLFFLGIGAFAKEQSTWLGAVSLIASICVGYCFVRQQLTLSAPMLPVDLLRAPTFALSIATSVLSFICQMLAYVALPFYFQHTLGRSVVETGLLMTPWPVATALMAPLAGRLADRYPAGILGGLGLATLAAGIVALARLPADASSIDIVWRMALCGIGFGLFQTPNNRAILLIAPVQRSGSAGGMLSTARLVGQTTGAALVALVFAWIGSAGSAWPLLLAVGFALLGALASLLRMLRPMRH